MSRDAAQIRMMARIKSHKKKDLAFHGLVLFPFGLSLLIHFGIVNFSHLRVSDTALSDTLLYAVNA